MKRAAETVGAEGILQIGLDARCLNRPHVRGMGKYVQSLIAHMPSSDEVRWHLFADRKEFPLQATTQPNTVFHLFEMRGWRFQAWEQFGLPVAARRWGVNVLHCCGTTLPWWQPVPTVVTLHDVLPWRDQNERATGGEIYNRRILPAAFRRCAGIITISECSRRDILELWPEVEHKLTVIPHGVDERYLTSQPEPLDVALRSAGIRAPYLVYIGGTIERKRLDWALKVVEGLRESQMQLIVCGVDVSDQAAVRKRVPAALRQRVVLASYLAEDVMPRLLQNAVAVLYPTLYEGFGLPALEAQAVGTPVLISKVGGLGELCGPGAIVCGPFELGAWMEAVIHCARRREKQPTPEDASRKWARQFSWEASAKAHLELYHHAVRKQSKRQSNGLDSHSGIQWRKLYSRSD